ncbi:MAG TPA: EI24 domain-containing protein [Vicinamibacteria bacterium]|nr:EI24 domain-containing protein [Vicinamibacteria bacterium]
MSQLETVEGGAPAASVGPGPLGAARRPGSSARRAAAGAWHVIAGFAFLLRRPRLWPLAALPAILAVVCILGGLFLALFAIPWLEQSLLPERGKVTAGVGIVLYMALLVGTLAAGVITGLAVAMLLAAPVLERLSRRVEAYVRVDVIEPEGGWKWELLQSFKGALYFLAAAPFVLLLSLIPLVGPPLGILWGAYALALQQTEVPLARRGMGFGTRRAWHRRWRAESLGFGLAGLFTLLVPLANLLLVPALAVGGTLLVLELEEDLVVPDRAASAPAATT